MKWFKKESHIWYAILTTFVVFVFCCGIGLGLFLGLDSKNAEVKHLKAENAVLARNLTQTEFLVVLLDLKLRKVNKLLFKWLEEDERIKEYNDTALE